MVRGEERDSMKERWEEAVGKEIETWRHGWNGLWVMGRPVKIMAHVQTEVFWTVCFY